MRTSPPRPRWCGPRPLPPGSPTSASQPGSWPRTVPLGQSAAGHPSGPRRRAIRRCSPHERHAGRSGPQRLLVSDALDRRRGDAAAEYRPGARRRRRSALEHASLATIRARLPASQRVAAGARIPGGPHPDLGARQLRPDRADRSRHPLRGLLPPVLAGTGSGRLRSDPRGDRHEPVAPADGLCHLASGSLAHLRELADRAAARFRHRQRREKRVAARAQRPLRGAGGRGAAGACDRRLARAPARSRRRPRRSRGLLAVPRAVAAPGSARLGMGATLGHAHLTAAARTRIARRWEQTMSSSPTAMTEIRSPERSTPFSHPPALPRLLAGIRPHGAMAVEEHLALHGPLPLGRGGPRRQLRERAAMLIDEIERAGLLGRGGAAFPTATKMRAVADARGRAIVVANAAEGEPASLKDRTLLETLPHLVLDGAVIAAEAVGADEVIVCVCETAGQSIEAVEHAIAERSRSSELAAGSPKVRLATVPSHYVAGQESALVNYITGGAGKPTSPPPMPFEQGVRRRPTLVDNVETLAHVALIARHGAPWFRELGIPTQPGSTLITLCGPVTHPGVYEIEHGASLASLIEASGG